MTGVALASIRADIQAQPRAIIDTALVGEYAEAMAAGAEFPPLVVFFDGQINWLADGFHRFYAAQGCECREIACDVREGGLREAVLYSVSANAVHGLRRTNEDKRRAVQKLLDDAEWSGWSNREIARRCAVDETLVRKMKPEPAPDTAVEPQYEPRTFTHPRTGKPTTMNTAAIGRREPVERVAPVKGEEWSRADVSPAPQADVTDMPLVKPSQPSAYFTEGDISTFNDLVEVDQAMARLPSPDEAIGKIARRVRHRFSAERFEEIAEWFQLFADLWRETEASDVAAE